MKLKSLKKDIKQHLFRITIYKTFFMVFEIKLNNQLNVPLSTIVTTESISRQIFNKLKYVQFDQLKFPNNVTSITSLADLIYYFSLIKQQKNIKTIFLIKIYFFFLKRNVHILLNIFGNKKNSLFFINLVPIIAKKEILLTLCKNLSYPFVTV